MSVQLNHTEVSGLKWALVESFVRGQRVARAKAAKRARQEGDDLTPAELDPIVPAVECRRTRERRR